MRLSESNQRWRRAAYAILLHVKEGRPALIHRRGGTSDRGSPAQRSTLRVHPNPHRSGVNVHSPSDVEGSTPKTTRERKRKRREEMGM